MNLVVAAESSHHFFHGAFQFGDTRETKTLTNLFMGSDANADGFLPDGDEHEDIINSDSIPVSISMVTIWRNWRKGEGEPGLDALRSRPLSKLEYS